MDDWVHRGAAYKAVGKLCKVYTLKTLCHLKSTSRGICRHEGTSVLLRKLQGSCSDFSESRRELLQPAEACREETRLQAAAWELLMATLCRHMQSSTRKTSSNTT